MNKFTWTEYDEFWVRKSLEELHIFNDEFINSVCLRMKYLSEYSDNFLKETGDLAHLIAVTNLRYKILGEKYEEVVWELEDSNE